MTASAVILAAGSGKRMAASENKIFLPIGNHALLWHTVAAWVDAPGVQELILVTRLQDIDRIRQLVQPLAPHCRFVEGGATRRDSSLAGVEAATGDVVLIHDGARPFPTSALIERVLSATCKSGAAIPVLPLSDLVHHCNPESRRVTEIGVLHGPELVRVQTPQGFRRELIQTCLRSASPNIRDDATAIFLAGHDVVTVAGDPSNIKVTHPDDLPLAAAIAAHRVQQRL